MQHEFRGVTFSDLAANETTEAREPFSIVSPVSRPEYVRTALASVERSNSSYGNHSGQPAAQQSDDKEPTAAATLHTATLHTAAWETGSNRSKRAI